MSISSNNIRKAGPYSGNGATVAFPFSFKVFKPQDVLVVLTAPSGVETTQTISTEYTVSLNANQDTSPGGTVTMLSSPATGYLLTIGSQVQNTQPTIITNTGGFQPSVLNDSFDRSVIQVQQLAEKLSRTVLLPFSAPPDVLPQLPLPSPLKLIGWDGTGKKLQNYEPSAGGVGGATVSVGTVTTGAAGSNVVITNSGTTANAVLNFSIPRGDAGANGSNGANGAAATVAIGTVTTGAAGSSASVTNVGTSTNAILNMTIPRGNTGASGGGYVSVDTYGAVGNGTTDDTAAINAALAACPQGGAVLLTGTHRVTSTITVPVGKSIEGLFSASLATFGVPEIIGDLSVSPIVTLDGGAGSGSAGAKRFAISRAAGTFSTTSIGLLVNGCNEAVVEDVFSVRSAIGARFYNAVACNANRLNTSACTKSHVEVEASVEITFNDCRFGRNGNVDVACDQYVQVKNADTDTLRFIGCQFNQSGAAVTRLMNFLDYSSPNGIFFFVNCHAEEYSNGFTASGTTSSVKRIIINGCTFTVPSVQFLVNMTSKLSELIITGSLIQALVTIDSGTRSVLTGNRIVGQLLVNNGDGVFTGNSLGTAPSFPGTNTYILANNNLVDGVAAPSGSGITSGDVTTALGFTPYNASNPAGYITASALSPYALNSALSAKADLSGATFTNRVDVGSTFRATGLSAPVSGAGVELSYNGSGYLIAYDRTASAYKDLKIGGNKIEISSGSGLGMLIDVNNYGLFGYSTSNGAYKLQVNGQIFATSATIATSDKRAKKDIEPLQDGLMAVLRLNPVTFNFIESEQHDFPKERQVGFIAQHVERALCDAPYLKSIVSDNGGELKGLAEAKIIPLLVNAIKDLYALQMSK